MQIFYCDKCGLRLPNDEAAKVPPPNGEDPAEILCSKCAPSKPISSARQATMKPATATVVAQRPASTVLQKPASGARVPVQRPPSGPQTVRRQTAKLPARKATPEPEAAPAKTDANPNSAKMLIGAGVGAAVLTLVVYLVMSGGKKPATATADADKAGKASQEKSAAPKDAAKSVPAADNRPQPVVKPPQIDLGTVNSNQPQKRAEPEFNPRADYERRVKEGQIKPAAVPVELNEPLPNTPLDDPGWKSIFNGRDLSEWQVNKGKWGVEDGAIVSTDSSERGGNLETNENFGDFEFACKVSIDKTPYGELFLRGYNGFGLHPRDKKGEWIEIRAVVRGQTFKVTYGSEELTQMNEKTGQATGSVGFYISKGGTMKVKDIKIRPIPAKR